jgi:hypothetical protein
VPVDIEFVGGPLDGKRVALGCTVDELPPALKASDRIERVDLEAQSRTVRYERDTAPIGPTWHYRYETGR